MVEVRGSCGENQEAHDKQAADLLAQAAKAAPIERSALENRPPIRSRPPRNRLSASTKEPFGLRCQEVLRRYFQLWPGTPVRCNAAILLVPAFSSVSRLIIRVAIGGRADFPGACSNRRAWTHHVILPPSIAIAKGSRFTKPSRFSDAQVYRGSWSRD